MKRRLAKRFSQRGFSHVSMTLEAAAVMGWFAVLVLGEKYLGDAVAARRAAENTAQQSSVASAMSYCEGSANAPKDGAAQGSVQVRENGKLGISQILSIVAGLGFGSQKTYSLYTDPFRGAFANASVGGVKPDARVGEGTHTFRGDRTLACLERSKDSPIPSIEDYRTPIFEQHVKPW